MLVWERARTWRALAMAGCAAAILAACSRPHPEGASHGPAGAYRVYVTNERSGDLTVIDGVTRQVVGTVQLGKRPRGVRLSPDGKLLYVALSGSPIAGPGVDESKLPPPDKTADGIAVLDAASGKVLRRIGGISDPEQLAVGKDNRLYVASEDTGEALALDAASGAVLARIKVGPEPEGVAVSPDGAQIWVTSEGAATVTVIDTRSLKPLKTIPVGERPRNTAFAPDASRAYVVGEQDRVVKVIDTRTLEPTNTVTIAQPDAKPMGVVVAPSGDRIFITTGRGGEVVALDARSLSVLGSVKVGARPWGVALSPDGRWLYTANGPSNDVAVVDVQTLAVVARIPAGTGPWGVQPAPAS